MKADFSRATFRPAARYSAVLAQQGRVQLDADANEQAAIQLYLARTTAADIIGPHGGPADGFTVSYVPSPDGKQPADLRINPGRYYVDGVLVDSTPAPPFLAVGEEQTETSGGGLGYWNQPFAYLDQENTNDLLPAKFPFLVYLSVVEQLVTAVQDPLIRESALGVALPDTSARSQVTWRALPLELQVSEQRSPADAFEQWVEDQTGTRSWLAAQVEKPAGTEDDPCLLAPDAAYRGPENQLYRVEIHTSGDASTATFKWSRDNGSIVFPITAVDGSWVSLASLGRDDKLAIEVGDWVEAVDDATTARGIASPLLQVTELDPAGGRVLLSGTPTIGQFAARHPLLRRWDQQGPGLREGSVPVAEGAWLNLEDGVQVWFQAGGSYRTGDYWLIPARTLTADVEWPRDSAGRPLLLPPAGPVVRYAPLAWITSDTDITQLRRTFQHLPNA